MLQRTVREFKLMCKEYLSSLSIDKLRIYGRYIGTDKPTARKKEDLVDDIIAVLSGEAEPVRTNRGAPIKNNLLDPTIESKIEQFRMYFLSGNSEEEQLPLPKPLEGSNLKKEMQDFQNEQHVVFRVEDPQFDGQKNKNANKGIYRGQLETLNGVPMLLPLNCIDNGEKLIVPIDLIRTADLREGDVVSCYAQKSHTALVATQILTVNDILSTEIKRSKFEECDVCYPTKKIKIYDGKTDNVTAKYLDWFLPMACGQRGCIVSAPKAGKTTLLYEIAQSLVSAPQGIKLFVLLNNQPPENVSAYRKIMHKDMLVYSTYEDEADRQVFLAEFILKRAKRLAESGNDVLLLVDSFNALAHAYNETDDSMGGRTLVGGLESKTLSFIKKIFGSARCLEKGGSLTILGSVSTATGNPADDLIASELSALANFEMKLNESLAVRRIYPAIDCMNSQISQSDKIFTSEEKAMDTLIRKEFLPAFGEDGLREIFETSKTFEDAIKKVRKCLNK